MDEQIKKSEPTSNIFSRRYFFELIGGWALGISAIGGSVLTLQFLSPNVLFEPSMKFKVGLPEDFPPDSITLIKEQKVFIVHAKEGYYYALSAICTHLGCIVNWKSEQNIIACPCHGSKFDKEGKIMTGPAPKSLHRLALSIDDHGQLIVDKSSIVGEEVILKV